MDVVAKSLPLGGPIFFFGMNPRGEGERTLEVASLMRFNGEIEFAGLEILYWKIRSPVLPIDDFPPGGCAVTGKKRTEDSPDMTHRSVIAIALVAPGACLSSADERPQIVARYSPIALTGLGCVCPGVTVRRPPSFRVNRSQAATASSVLAIWSATFQGSRSSSSLIR